MCAGVKGYACNCVTEAGGVEVLLIIMIYMLTRAWVLQGQAHGNAEVLKCLVKTYGKLAEGCQREMSRAVRMALWEYKKGAALTGWCDADVEAIPNCQTAVANPKNR